MSEFVDDFGHPIFPHHKIKHGVDVEVWYHRIGSFVDCEVRGIPPGRYLPRTVDNPPGRAPA